MSNDNEHIYVEFHSKARTLFFNAIKEFELAAKKLNRQTEEYRFVQLKEKHVHTLKLQLEYAANLLIEQHQHQKQLDELYQSLQKLIKHYLHRFVIKSRAL